MSWDRVEEDGVEKLRRAFRFRDFAEALRFANRVGELAEAENHHPELLVEWGRVTVTWWTHVTRGVTERDVALAAKTDALAGFPQAPAV